MGSLVDTEVATTVQNKKLMLHVNFRFCTLHGVIEFYRLLITMFSQQISTLSLC